MDKNNTFFGKSSRQAVNKIESDRRKRQCCLRLVSNTGFDKGLTKYTFLGFTFLAFILLSACKETKEGCLDVDAVNYDVSADDACPDCCTFPHLSLEIAHRFDTLRFSFDSIYMFEGDKKIRFEQVIFFLSDFRLVNQNDSLETNESIELDVIGGGTATFKDDFTLVSRSFASFDYDVAEIRGMGTFNTLKFSVGFSQNANLTNAEALTIGHPLALNADIDTLWTADEGYISNRIIVIPDTNFMFSRPIDIKDRVDISLMFEQEVKLGFDVKIPLKIDYQKWFSGIDFEGLEEDIIQEIVEQTAEAFSIRE